MIKRYGELSDGIFRNHGYCPYNQATKYKLSYLGEVHYVYVTSYKELKYEIAILTGDYHEAEQIHV